MQRTLTRMELDPGWRAHGCVLKGGPIYLQIEVGMNSACTDPTILQERSSFDCITLTINVM